LADALLPKARSNGVNGKTAGKRRGKGRAAEARASGADEAEA
jgi:hypothetical protein